MLWAITSALLDAECFVACLGLTLGIGARIVSRAFPRKQAVVERPEFGEAPMSSAELEAMVLDWKPPDMGKLAAGAIKRAQRNFAETDRELTEAGYARAWFSRRPCAGCGLAGLTVYSKQGDLWRCADCTLIVRSMPPSLSAPGRPDIRFAPQATMNDVRTFRDLFAAKLEERLTLANALMRHPEPESMNYENTEALARRWKMNYEFRRDLGNSAEEAAKFANDVTGLHWRVGEGYDRAGGN